MVREGWLERGPASKAQRGGEPFVRWSWDKALDLVAGELARVKTGFGTGRSSAAPTAGRAPAASTHARHPASSLPLRSWRLRRAGHQLQLCQARWCCCRISSARSSRPRARSPIGAASRATPT
ncbi:MAG: hypothetical protein WDO24_22895 [Pseudomonadota bacterium]